MYNWLKKQISFYVKIMIQLNYQINGGYYGFYSNSKNRGSRHAL